MLHIAHKIKLLESGADHELSRHVGDRWAGGRHDCAGFAGRADEEVGDAAELPIELTNHRPEIIGVLLPLDVFDDADDAVARLALVVAAVDLAEDLPDGG